MLTKEERKEYNAKYSKTEDGKAAHRKAKVEYNKSEKGKAADAKYNKSEKGKAAVVEYRKSEKGKAAQAKYRKSEKGKAADRKRGIKYSKTKKGKIGQIKRNSKRRSLGHIELNDPFMNSDAHHIDKEFVIHIPGEMHRSVRHNVFTGKNMGVINALAIDFCYGD